METQRDTGESGDIMVCRLHDDIVIMPVYGILHATQIVQHSFPSSNMTLRLRAFVSRGNDELEHKCFMSGGE